MTQSSDIVRDLGAWLDDVSARQRGQRPEIDVSLVRRAIRDQQFARNPRLASLDPFHRRGRPERKQRRVALEANPDPRGEARCATGGS
jgi:hypothetical protein